MTATPWFLCAALSFHIVSLYAQHGEKWPAIAFLCAAGLQVAYAIKSS